MKNEICEVSALFANLLFKCLTKLQNVCLIYFQITWMIAEIRVQFVFCTILFLEIKVQFISYTIVRLKETIVANVTALVEIA